MSVGGPKKLTDLSKEEQLKFFESFDIVFADVDGVLWYLGQGEIEGSPEGLAALRSLGKKCRFITNNSTLPLKFLVHHRMKKFNIKEEEVIRPATALIWYLRNIKFDKEIYVVGVDNFKNELKEAGFKVVSDKMEPIPETAEGLVDALKSISPDVGAVIIDFALNVSFVAFQKCVEYIMKNNALFLVGAWDPKVPFRGSTLIGTSYFIKAIEEISGKKPLILSKPGKEFNDLIVEKLGPLDPKRVLFIGDSAETDMAFATKFGYQKLLPLTGYITKEDLKNWSFDESWKPDYYIDSLKDFDTIVKNLGLTTNGKL